MKTLSLDECLRLTYQHPGLVVGTSATCHTAAASELSRQIASAIAPIEIPPQYANFRDTVDFLKRDHLNAVPAVENLIRDYFTRIHASPNVEHLAAGRWSVVVSLTNDLHFEDALHNRLDRVPSSQTATIVSHPTIVPPQNTLPIFKLLGNVKDVRQEHALAFGTADLHRRKSYWRKLVPAVADYLREAPLFFAGLETQLDVVKDLLAEILAAGAPYPSRFVFLKNDPVLADPTVLALVSPQTAVFQVDATLRDFCEATAAAKPTSLLKIEEAANLPIRNKRLAMVMEDYRMLVDLVPSGLPEGFDARSSHLRLIDGLFRPTSLDWLPYLCDYDMRRSEVSAIEETVALKKQYIAHQPHPFVIVKGEAGIGKTTLAKRVAVNLSKKGEIVLWCRKSPSFTPHTLRKMALSLREAIQNDDNLAGKPVVVICDDPWGARVLPIELMSVFEQAGLPTIFLFFVRLSDSLTDSNTKLSFPSKPDDEITLQFSLSPEDIEELKQLLVRVNVAANEAEAAAKIQSMPTDHSDDVLCSLWYLLPQTHSQLSGSIHDEYGRLGLSNAVKQIASQADDLGEQVRLAYECVAVMSNLGMGMPIQVLLRATGATYESWLSSSKEGEALWGLLYDVLDPESGQILYYTRNEIVTRILLDIVNGGIGHAGEFRRLKQLIEACSIGGVVYRTFLSDLLGRQQHRLMDILSYEQGAELYETALAVFPELDRHLRYRYGRWKHQAGRDYAGAYHEYQTALETPNYMYATRTEPEEHIHTSSAAAVVARVKEGSQDTQTGLNLVQHHLREASQPRSFDPHSMHVFSNLFYQIARRSRDEHDANVALESFSESLRTIERSLQVIGAEGRKRIRYAKDLQMFQELQAEILDNVGDVEQLQAFARDAFISSGLQSGFEVCGRKMLVNASRSDKGSDFKDVLDYLDTVYGLIKGSGSEVSIELVALRVDLMIRWRVQKPRGPIDWPSISQGLEAIVANSKYRDDYIRHYYYGVALYHCGEYSKALNVFENLRTRIKPTPEIRRSIRNYLLGPEGLPKRVQGVLKRAHERYYAFVPELGVEVYVGPGDVNAQENATIHPYIAFTMEGPRAMMDRPGDNEMLLP